MYKCKKIFVPHGMNDDQLALVESIFRAIYGPVQLHVSDALDASVKSVEDVVRAHARYLLSPAFELASTKTVFTGVLSERLEGEEPHQEEEVGPEEDLIFFGGGLIASLDEGALWLAGHPPRRMDEAVAGLAGPEVQVAARNVAARVMARIPRGLRGQFPTVPEWEAECVKRVFGQ